MPDPQKTFLFLQGPISPFFSEIASQLESKGHTALKINLCFGDTLFWRRKGVTNYRKSQKAWPAFIQNFYADNAITDIVLLGEARYYHKVAIEEAKARGIRVVATDFGYIRPDWITLERDGLTGNSNFPRDPQDILDLALQCPERDKRHLYQDHFLKMASWDILYHLSSMLFWVLFPGYKSHQLHNPILIYLGTGIRLLKSKRDHRSANREIAKLVEDKKPFFVFPLQMATDFSIRAYSHYPDLQTVIEEIFCSFKKNSQADSQLVVKIHPMDPGLENWEKIVAKIAAKHGVSERTLFLRGGDLKTLLDHTLGVVTVNSTVGIWALSAGVPLKALGRAIYDVKGLVHKGDLDTFWKNPIKPDAVLNESFLRAIAGTLLIRGVFYNRPGLDVAVSQAVIRLDQNLINTPVEFTTIEG